LWHAELFAFTKAIDDSAKARGPVGARVSYRMNAKGEYVVALIFESFERVRDRGVRRRWSFGRRASQSPAMLQSRVRPDWPVDENWPPQLLVPTA